MPRSRKDSRSGKRSTPERRESSRPFRPRRLGARELDAQVLSLRETGNSYSAIARSLELGRATDAHKSFIRALGAYEGAERQRLVGNEEARLDLLEDRIRSRDQADPAKVERRLSGVEKLREAVRA